MAKHVPAFWTTTPTSMGSPGGGGTSRPKIALISCFSAPWGYFNCKPCTFIWGSSFTALDMVSIASGLFASIPTKALPTLSTFMISLRPATIFSGSSSMTLWSAVRYGSHSTPFIMTVSILLPLGGDSLTTVGKAAPPIPTIPAFRILSKISLGSNL